ncbi:conserved hypothetical protein [Gammaproteobacteria bacterium]
MMSDKPRDWPNNAKEARDRAAEAAVEIVKSLGPLMDERIFTESERIRRESRALNQAQLICRLLEGVGAPTRA